MDIESPQCGILKSSYSRQINSSSRASEKKLRKRKELDAMLIVRHKQKNGNARSPGSNRHHELLRDYCSDDTSTDDTGLFRSGGRGGKGSSCSSGPEGKGGSVLNWQKNCCHGFCCVITVFASLVAIISVIWLHIQMKMSVDRFRLQLDSVVEERKLANDNHHRYHTQMQEIMANQSMLTNNVTLLYQLYHNYSSQVTKLGSIVNTLVKTLESAPELKSLPKDMQDTKKNLAKFGSHLTDLDSRVTKLETKLSNSVSEIAHTLNKTLQKRDDEAYELFVRNIVQEKVQPIQKNLKHIDDYFANNITEQLKSQEINFAQNLKMMNELEDNMKNVTQANKKNEDNFRKIMERLQKLDEIKRVP